MTTRHGPGRPRRSLAGSLRRAQASPAAHTPVPEPPLLQSSDIVAVASSSFSSCAASGPYAQPARRQMCWVYSQSASRSMKTGTHRRGHRWIPTCAGMAYHRTAASLLLRRPRGGGDPRRVTRLDSRMRGNGGKRRMTLCAGMTGRRPDDASEDGDSCHAGAPVCIRASSAAGQGCLSTPCCRRSQLAGLC